MWQDAMVGTRDKERNFFKWKNMSHLLISATMIVSCTRRDAKDSHKGRGDTQFSVSSSGQARGTVRSGVMLNMTYHHCLATAVIAENMNCKTCGSLQQVRAWNSDQTPCLHADFPTSALSSPRNDQVSNHRWNEVLLVDIGPPYACERRLNAA